MIVAVAALVTMTAAVTATMTAAAAAVVSVGTVATSKTMPAVQTRLWGLPEVPAYPRTAAMPVAAESSCRPEAIPPKKGSLGCSQVTSWEYSVRPDISRI